MCAVSYVGDYWANTAPNRHPWIQPYTVPYIPISPSIPPGQSPYPSPNPTREEFEALKKEMEELKKLLKAAQEYDTKTGQHDCEMEEKIALIKKISKIVGVDFNDIFLKKD